MYDIMRRDYYWPHMAHNVYETLKPCHSCAEHWKKIKSSASFVYSHLLNRWSPFHLIFSSPGQDKLWQSGYHSSHGLVLKADDRYTEIKDHFSESFQSTC